VTPILWPIMTLSAGAAWALLAGAWPRVSLAGALTAIAGSGLACICIGLFPHLGQGASSMALAWPLPLGGAQLQCDGLSAWFLLATGGVSVSVALYTWGYLTHSGGQRSLPAFGALMCGLVAAILVVVCAANAVMFLLGWELMSLSAFFLIGFHDRDPDVRKGAWMYLVATHLATAIGVVPVFAVLAARAGSLEFSAFSSAIAPADVASATALFGLGLVGFGTKIGLVPFHVWLPAAHPVAPSPVSALMSAVVIKTGVYGLLRLLSWLPPLPLSAGVVVLLIGTLTGAFGILYSLGQKHLKRMLAYSSVENVGIVLLGIGAGMLGRTAHQLNVEILGFAGALLHVLNHAFFKALLFLSAGAVIHGTGTEDIERLGGLAKKLRAEAGLCLVASVAICGLPPLNGFLSEFLIYKGLLAGSVSLPPSLSAAMVAATAGLALIGGLSLAAFSKVFGLVFLGAPKEQGVTSHASPRSMIGGMFALAFACVLVSGFAWALAPHLSRAMGPLVAPVAMMGDLPDETLRSLSLVGAAFLCLAVAAGVLAVVRSRWLRRAPAIAAAATWGCGFARPTARMQYSGESFSGTLAHSFRHVLRSRRTVALPEGYFPIHAHVATRVPDVVQSRLFDPVFATVARTCERCWPLQHGRLQLYLLYIVGTVLIVFSVETWGRSPASWAPPEGAASSSVTPPEWPADGSAQGSDQ